MRKIIVFSFLQVLLILSIGCKTHYVPVKSNFRTLKVQAGADTVGRLITPQFLKPYQQKLKDSFSTVLTTTNAPLIKKRPGGSLGNLVTTAVLRYYHQSMDTDKDRNGEMKPVFILMNYGGIRLKEIAKGPITTGKIFELLPFENTLVRIRINGQQLATLLRKINKGGGWPSLDAHFPYEVTGLENAKITATLEEIEQEKEILLITNNYIASGGDNCSILKTLPQKDTRILLRNVVIDYLRAQQTFDPDTRDYIVK